MFRGKLFYYLANYTLQHSFEKKVINFLKKEKKLIIFDIGCYRGIFTKTILNLLGRKRYKFYLFDINKNVKNYLKKILKLKNIYYNEIALSNKNGTANYNYNSFFESAGSSLSNLFVGDKKWNFSRKLLLKILLFYNYNNGNGFVKYQVPTITLDNFAKKNKIRIINLLKIDVEGSEYNLLKGAKKTLKKNKIKIILIEIMEKKHIYVKKEKKILNLLKRGNFNLIKKKNLWFTSIFSNIKGADYLFINNKYF